MKTVAFVPIKFNSTRLPHKNILPIGDHPMCWHIFNTLLKVKQQSLIDEIYVYCSDDKILEYIPRNITFLKRSEELDKDETLGMDIYKSFVNEILADVYILCHATAPLLNEQSIVRGINAINSGQYDSAFSCQKIKTFAWYNNSPLNYDLTHVPRTQDIEPIYVETSGFYIFTKDIIAKNRRIGYKPKQIDISNIESIDIDYKDDYEMACTAYEKYYT
jgi:CMP-N-acetylneuraminic acid synthetase